MNYEENRLSTFSTWPSSAEIEPIRVAKAGFFYTGQGVEVQCFCCGGKISDWNCGDNAMARHRRLDPRCPFLLDPDASGNVSLVLGQPCSRGGGNDVSSMPPRGSTSSEQSESNPLDTRPTLNNDDEIYRNDALRLLSFVSWPVRFISRESLASAGFYHAGGGRVRCAWCGGELCGGWRPGDRPIDEHRRHFPLCEYAQRAAATPPPPSSQSDTSETPPVGSPAEEPRSTVEVGLDAAAHLYTPFSEAVEHNWQVLESVPWRGLGVVGCGAESAKHPGRSSLASRIASFTGWPSTMRQTPELLAEAGFYYIGSEDQVICYYCGGGLGKWEPSDVPWCEHARWFPACGYVQLVKGRDFIERCRRPPSTQSNTTGNGPRRTIAPSRVQFPVTDAQVEREMESASALAALGTGLGVARVRTAIRRRLCNTGMGFQTSEALIDAALNEQLNEESWSTAPDQLFARDILAETLRTLRTAATDTLERAAAAPRTAASPSPEARAPAPPSETAHAAPLSGMPSVSLEEENRQLKEARLCKVCMDCEVSVVFLPCGHLVSCGPCGASLSTCPLCRAAVHAFVRAYLA